MADKIRTAVVGATGVAGQQFLAALANHPQIQITKLAASPRSAGKPYADAIRSEAGQMNWYADAPLAPSLASLMVEDADQLDVSDIDLVFSCVESDAARKLESRYAEQTAVLSTASAFRYEDDVPILLPGVNLDQVGLLEKQRAKRGWKGFVSPNPNCTTVGLAITLAPLHRAFGVKRVLMTSMQAVSGAGRSPGVPALDAIDNIIPYIPKEEEKVEKETRKILGSFDGDRIHAADFAVSCTCTRVGVIEGHTESVFVQLERPVKAEEVTAAWREFGKDFVKAGYPTAPEALIHVSEDPYRPQVRLDRDAGDGMTTVVGRLREDPATTNGWKYMLVSHNTKMGAAKGTILVGEHLIAKGLIRRR